MGEEFQLKVRDGVKTIPLPVSQMEVRSSRIMHPSPRSLLSKTMSAHMDDLTARVDAVKEDNLELKSETRVLGQYKENLMSASSVFQTADTKSKKKKKKVGD
ncbi:short coiled-coil protein-like [Lepus europaeus]|uniref:short coiled-coil protein-like n=1 Tax=Lepus europaeus TaxID=9983 RepID=UPI002B48C7E0|nr:short coiled-coil protein-like [Lepus europaeus]